MAGSSLSLSPPIGTDSEVLEYLSLGGVIAAPDRARSESSGSFIADLDQAHTGLCQLLTVSVPGGGKSRGERVRYGG